MKSTIPFLAMSSPIAMVLFLIFIKRICRVLIAEAYTDMNHTMDYYGTKEKHVTNFPFNFLFVTLKSYSTAKAYNDLIHVWLNNMPKGAVANWMVIFKLRGEDNFRLNIA